MIIYTIINDTHCRYYSLKHYYLPIIFEYNKKDMDNHLLFYQKNEKVAIYHMTKILNKSLDIIRKSFPSEINQHELELFHIVDKYREKDRGIKKFCPAGSYNYKKSITINTNLFSYYSKLGRTCDKLRISHVFLHEVGHAIPYLENEQFIKAHKLIDYKGIFKSHFLYNMNFLSMVKKNYKNYHAAHLDKKASQSISYFVKPANSYLDMNIQAWKRKNGWIKSSEESFAESFSLLMGLFVNGLELNKYQAIYQHKTYLRSYIKIMLPTIKFLLKEIDWIKLGIPELLYRKRFPVIQLFLKKIDSLPYLLKNNIRIGTHKKQSKFPKIHHRKL